MFTPDFSEYSWAPELAEAAFRGPDEARRFARRVRPQLSDEEADAIGEELVVIMAGDVPDLMASLTAAAPAFAGPKTIARAGKVLRSTHEAWKIDIGFEILKDNHGPESAVQQLLCAREAAHVQVMESAARTYEFGRYSIRDISTAATAQVPRDDLERYLRFAMEMAMLEGARFEARDFQRTVTGPASSVLRRSIWAQYDGRRVERAFIMDPEDAGFLDTALERVELSPDSPVGLVHPAELTPVERVTWGVLFADYEVVGLFPQLDRPCERARSTFPYGPLGRTVPVDELHRSLFSHGWRHRSSAARSAAGGFEMPLRGATLRLDAHPVSDERIQLDAIRLSRPTLDRESREDDIIYSEALKMSVELLTQFAPDLV